MNRGVVIEGKSAASQAEGWVFESQPRRTYVVKSDSDSSTAKRSAIVLRVPRVLGDDHHKRITRVTVDVASHCSMAMSAEQNLQPFNCNGKSGTKHQKNTKKLRMNSSRVIYRNT